MNRSTKKQFEKGYSLLELIIYIGITGIVLTTVSGYFLNLAKSYNASQVQLSLNNSQLFILEKISEAVTFSDDVVDAECIFDNDQGKLTILKSNVKYSYYIENYRLVESVDTAAGVPVSATDVKVEKFRLTKINTSENEGITQEYKLSANGFGVGPTIREFSTANFRRDKIIHF